MIVAKRFMFLLMLLVLIITGSCKKENVVLEDPGKFSRSPELALPLYDIKFLPIDIFENANLPDLIIINEDSSINYKMSSPFEMPWEIEIPMNIAGLVGSEDRKETIDNFNMNIEFTNGIPFTIYTQIYAINDNGTIVDSLVSEDLSIWESPNVDANGVVEEALKHFIDVELDNNKITKLYDENVSKLKFVTLVSSHELIQKPNIPDEIVLPNSILLGLKLSVHLNKKEE